MNFTALGQGLSAIVVAIIGVAIVSVIVSRRANTAGLVTATGDTLAKVISAAVSPAGNAANNGNNGSNVFTTPAMSNGG